MPAPFVHLRVHTEFSLVDGLVRIKPLINKALEMEMPAVAVTDQCNFYGLIKFYRAAQGAGLKPIGGADFWVAPAVADAPPALITLLAMNKQGYRNMTELISMAYLKGQRQGVAYVERQWVSRYAEGVIALSGARFGDIGQALLSAKQSLAGQLLAGWMKDFPDRFYLELQRTGREGDEHYLHAAVALATEHQCPVVATNDVRFIDQSEFEVHEARVCIGEGRTLDDPRREHRYSDQQYLRSPEEMLELFSDIPEAIENTLEIARRCNLDIVLGKYFLPEYPIPEGMTENEFFEKISYQGLE
ncbi:MAG: PHP domain-containing protein, partial [Exilibacterium sp.]